MSLNIYAPARQRYNFIIPSGHLETVNVSRTVYIRSSIGTHRHRRELRASAQDTSHVFVHILYTFNSTVFFVNDRTLRSNKLFLWFRIARSAIYLNQLFWIRRVFSCICICRSHIYNSISLIARVCCNDIIAITRSDFSKKKKTYFRWSLRDQNNDNHIMYAFDWHIYYHVLIVVVASCVRSGYRKYWFIVFCLLFEKWFTHSVGGRLSLIYYDLIKQYCARSLNKTACLIHVCIIIKKSEYI